MLVVRRKDNETWREAVKRYAEPYGLIEEALSAFDANSLADEGQRAWEALYDWDLLDYEDRGPEDEVPT